MYSTASLVKQQVSHERQGMLTLDVAPGSIHTCCESVSSFSQHLFVIPSAQMSTNPPFVCLFFVFFCFVCSCFLFVFFFLMYYFYHYLVFFSFIIWEVGSILYFVWLLLVFLFLLLLLLLLGLGFVLFFIYLGQVRTIGYFSNPTLTL